MTKMHLYWVSEDGQGSIRMGEYESRADAEAAIDTAREELIAQCATDWREGDGGMSPDHIRKGTWSIGERP